MKSYWFNMENAFYDPAYFPLNMLIPCKKRKHPI